MRTIQPAFIKKKTLFPFWLCFGILIFRLGRKNCVVKNKKWIVFPESWYDNSNTGRATERFFFVIVDYFLPFYAPNNPENHNFEKMKNTRGDIIILHICTINENRMMPGCWEMERNSHFLRFCPTNNTKNQNFEKKLLEISSFYTSVPKIMIICYILFLRYGAWHM